MRIDTVRTGGVGARNAARGASAGTPFNVSEGAPAPRAAAAAPMAAAGAIDALLALQAAGDPLQGRRRSIRRGRSLLDMLDALKADLLLGRISEARLGQLMGVIAEARERTEPGLDAVLDDIELRARVELAKRGLFPAL